MISLLAIIHLFSQGAPRIVRYESSCPYTWARPILYSSLSDIYLYLTGLPGTVQYVSFLRIFSFGADVLCPNIACTLSRAYMQGWGG